jgi:tetratricopeptide (TPR) repeat protein
MWPSPVYNEPGEQAAYNLRHAIPGHGCCSLDSVTQMTAETSSPVLKRRRLFTVLLLCGSIWPAYAAALQSDIPLGPVTQASDTSMLDLIRAQRWRDVTALAQARLQKKPDDTMNLYWLGVARVKMADYIGSEQALRKAQLLGLNNAVLHENLGLAYFKLNQFLLFEQEMKRASDQDPKDITPYYYLGLYRLTIRSDVTGALEFFQRAMELRPDDWKSLYEAGNCLEKAGKATEAREYYLRAAASVEKSNAPFGWPFQGLARLLMQTDPKQALDFATRAVRLEPDEYSNYFVQAKVYKALGDLPAAIKAAQQAAVKNPTDASSRYLLFLLYRQQGERDAAQRELNIFQTLSAVYGSD